MARSVSFGTEKKVKLKDSMYKNSSLVSKIDRKNTKEKSRLLVKCFVNSFKKIIQYLLKMWQNCVKCHFLNQEKGQRKRYQSQN